MAALTRGQRASKAQKAALAVGLALTICVLGSTSWNWHSSGNPFAPAAVERRLSGEELKTEDEPKCRGVLCETKDNEKEIDGKKRPTVWWFLLNLLGLFYMFVALYIVCDEFFVPSLDKISNKLGLSPDVAGATFMAAGGSAPEFFTSAIGALSPEPSDVGIAAIVGSAVFNVLFVIGACGLAAPGKLKLTWYPLARDCTFYFIDLLLMLLFFLDGKIVWWEALILFALYIAYCVFMVFSSKVEKACKKSRSAESDSEDSDLQRFKALDRNKDGMLSAEEASEYEDLRERFNIMDVNRDGVLTFAEYRVYLRSRRNQKDSDDSGSDDDSNEPMGLGPPDGAGACDLLWYVFTLPLVVVLVLTVPDVRRDGCWEKCYVVGFFMSIVWVALFSMVMVETSEVVGAFTGIDPGILALTLLAWGTSVPDLLTSVLVTLQGHGDMAVSSSIGSNIFDVTVGLPVPWLLYCAINEGAPVKVGNDGLVNSIAMLVGMVAFVIVGIMCNKWILDLKLGLGMLILWLAFQIYSIVSFLEAN